MSERSITRNELAKLRLATLIANYSYSRSSQSRIFKNHYETINKNMPDCGERRKVFRTKNCRFKNTFVGGRAFGSKRQFSVVPPRRSSIPGVVTYVDTREGERDWSHFPENGELTVRKKDLSFSDNLATYPNYHI